jgi:integrase
MQERIWRTSCLSGPRGDRLEALYVLALHTGMRRGELLGLKWDDVDLEAATVRMCHTLTRTDNGKRVALGDPKTRSPRGCLSCVLHVYTGGP